MTRLISNVGLGISLLALCAALPRITQAGGMQRFVVDVCSQLWTMAILMLATNRARTIGWRACAGAALTGFLALTGLARFVGRPLIEHFGESNVFAIAVWVPLTEELLKMLPVLPAHPAACVAAFRFPSRRRSTRCCLAAGPVLALRPARAPLWVAVASRFSRTRRQVSFFQARMPAPLSAGPSCSPGT